MPEPQRPTVLRTTTPYDASGERAAAFSRDGSTDDQLSLSWYIAACRKHAALIISVALVGGAVGYGLAAARPTLYEASTAILVLPSPAAPDVMSSATLLAILQDGSLAAQVVSELGLDKPPAGLTPQFFLDSALTAEKVAGTNLVRVSVKLEDPASAAEAAKRLAEKGVALGRKVTEEQTAALQDQLRGRVADAQARMDAAQHALLAYQQRAQIDLMEEDSKALIDARRDLLNLLTEIETEKARLAAAEQQLTLEPQVLSLPRAVSAEAAVTPQSDRAGNPQRLDLSNPFVNPVYETLELQIANSRMRLAALEQQRHQLADVNKVGAEELGKLSELYQRRTELARLRGELDLASRIYDDVSVRYEQRKTDSLTARPSIELVDNVIPPGRPLSKGGTRLAGIGFGVGLLGSGLLALFLEGRRDRASRSRPDAG